MTDDSRQAGALEIKPDMSLAQRIAILIHNDLKLTHSSCVIGDLDDIIVDGQFDLTGIGKNIARYLANNNNTI